MGSFKESTSLGWRRGSCLRWGGRQSRAWRQKQMRNQGKRYSPSLQWNILLTVALKSMINRLIIRKTPSYCLVSQIWIQLPAAQNSSLSHLRWQKQLRSRVQGMVENHLLGIKRWALLNWNNHQVPSQLISSWVPSHQICNRRILQSSLPHWLEITLFILPSTMVQRSSQTKIIKDMLRLPSDTRTNQMLTPWETYHSSKVLVQSLSIRSEMT